jgi:hypothetical protein
MIFINNIYGIYKYHKGNVVVGMASAPLPSGFEAELVAGDPGARRIGSPNGAGQKRR